MRGASAVKRFMWTPAQRRAFQLEYEGRLTQAQIADELGTTRRTVEGWVRRPAWRTAAEARQNAFKARWESEWKARLEQEYGPKRPPDTRTAAEREAAEAADTAAWLAWKLACHAARRAHRTLPPEPPELA